MNLQTEFPDRLLTLSTGQPGLRGLIQIKTREPEVRDNSCNPCLDFVSSDETLDRYSEIISASGWRLDTYRRNPVFQNSHQYGDIIFTLGRALTTEIHDSKLIQRIQFAVDANPMARIAYNLYRGKFLHAVSVGFSPVRWENGTEQTAFRRKYTEQELLEVSAVAIPANPNALTLAYKSGAVQKSDLQETIDLFRQTIAPNPPIKPSTLSLLRQLHSILRS
jgi:HK97 family phage prohead protease